MNTKHPLIVLLACGALFTASGCKPKAPGISDIQSTSGDRHIHVRIEGGAWVESGEDRFTVKLPGHELVIGKEHVLVDKQERAKVPANAKKFEVVSMGGALTVTADGTEILNTPLAK